MPDGHEPVLNMELNIEIFEYLVIKLSAIINDDGVWKSKSVDNWFLEGLDLTLGIMC